jgi:hypothetical protein
MDTPNRPASRWPIARWVDSLGTVGAMLCAVHCALLPFALVLLPVIGLGIFASTRFEQGFVLFATALAIASLWHGYRGHRAYHAFAVLVPGLASLWMGILVPALHHARVPHAIAMSIGGTLVAAAHLVNLRLSRGHTHGHAPPAPADAHGHGHGHAHPHAAVGGPARSTAEVATSPLPAGVDSRLAPPRPAA